MGLPKSAKNSTYWHFQTYMGGQVGPKITDIKILWVKVLHAKNGDFLTFSDKTLPCSIDCAPKPSKGWVQEIT